MQATILKLTQGTVGVTGRSHRSLPPSRLSAKVILLLELGRRINKQNQRGPKTSINGSLEVNLPQECTRIIKFKLLNAGVTCISPRVQVKEISNNHVWMRSPKMMP